MTLLALDLGTNCGWCVGDDAHHVSGTWALKPGRYESSGMRFVKFRTALREIIKAYPVGHVVYEEVRRHAGTDAAHIYGGLMATLQAFCEEYKLPYDAIPVGTIKKFWTGKGNANKAAMIAECEDRGLFVRDDNEADAVALFHCKIQDGDIQC